MRSVWASSGDEVDEKVWAALVDATYRLGDRTLYLRLPHFHGRDVLDLQQALGALGFSRGSDDGIFGAHTESALRRFQLNMGLPSDGIAGAYTYACIRNLHHSWEGKGTIKLPVNLGFARAANVLESRSLCLFGTDGFTRSVASRMSNLALATNPASRIVSAEALSVLPGEGMLLVHIVLPGEESAEGCPRVAYGGEGSLARRSRFGALTRHGCPNFAHCNRITGFYLGRCGRGPLCPALCDHVARCAVRRIVLSVPAR